MKSIITANEAFDLAQKEINGLMASGDTLFRPWKDAGLTQPILVSTLTGSPSYWLVPFETMGYVVGAVRVSVQGVVLTAGVFARDRDKITDCPKVCTGISKAEAMDTAKVLIEKSEEVSGIPIFVHDGPVGREVWLIKISKKGKPHHSLFVTSSGTYERPEGVLPDPDLEA